MCEAILVSDYVILQLTALLSDFDFLNQCSRSYREATAHLTTFAELPILEEVSEDESIDSVRDISGQLVVTIENPHQRGIFDNLAQGNL